MVRIDPKDFEVSTLEANLLGEPAANRDFSQDVEDLCTKLEMESRPLLDHYLRKRKILADVDFTLLMALAREIHKAVGTKDLT